MAQIPMNMSMRRLHAFVDKNLMGSFQKDVLMGKLVTAMHKYGQDKPYTETRDNHSLHQAVKRCFPGKPAQPKKAITSAAALLDQLAAKKLHNCAPLAAKQLQNSLDCAPVAAKLDRAPLTAKKLQNSLDCAPVAAKLDRAPLAAKKLQNSLDHAPVAATQNSPIDALLQKLEAIQNDVFVPGPNMQHLTNMPIVLQGRGKFTLE